MKALPPELMHYKSSPEFNEHSAPLALQRPHTTAARVWGRIRIFAGTLRYVIDGDAGEQHMLDEEHSGIIEPGVVHHVELVGPVRFTIEFHR